MGFWGDIGNSLGFNTGDGIQYTSGYTRPDQAAQAFDRRQQATGYDPAQQQASRQVLANLAGDLQGQAAGTAPSMAALQLKQGNEQAQRNMLGALTAQRGMNPGVVASLASNQAAQAAQATNAQAAQAAIAERNAAQGLLGQVGGQMRAQDLQAGQQLNDLSTFNANQGNQLLAGDVAAQNQLAGQQNTMVAQEEQARRQRLMKTMAALAGAASGIPGAVATGGMSIPGSLAGIAGGAGGGAQAM